MSALWKGHEERLRSLVEQSMIRHGWVDIHLTALKMQRTTQAIRNKMRRMGLYYTDKPKSERAIEPPPIKVQAQRVDAYLASKGVDYARGFHYARTL